MFCKSCIFQNLPDANPVRIITDKTFWWACMKKVSETSTALRNGQQRGVGLGQTGIHASERHFFYFDNNPTIVAPYQSYATAVGMTNLTIIISNNNATLPYSMHSTYSIIVKTLFLLQMFRFVPYLLTAYFISYFSSQITLDNDCQFVFDVVCKGLDWAINNLLVPYRASANHVFQTVLNGTPSITVLGK